ncbi:iron chelate uptake ABC transporter family permease subunit [Pseudaestuariivita atlantica]|uniref:High-affinity zinc uptake system membrane protein ZnuB n=1 Tax=Pseudaestuariivita atlantica TaxID=1317121 RepID=A0A0L1JSV3_9RHOB|nr:iron chelate uptake ABC transporter family permease subunit [Pseudaestuariivita atlantica]KNG94453.1 membrane protein [Pseudaestuariivita atlantica]
MFDDFLLRATLAGIGVAIAAAPVGCFVVWRRMAYFGDATAHASLMGVALALATDLPVFAGALVASIAMAGAVAALAGRQVPSDTLLGVLAHSALALGLVAAALVPGVRVDLAAYLFGDILAVNQWDLAVIWGGAALISALLAWRWNALLTITLNPDLAQADGISPPRDSLALTLALACLVAVAIKVVGVLLIVALLLIPAAAARPFAATPERMALIAAGIGAASAVLGLQLSLALDTPPGPSIVCVAAGLFVVSRSLRALAP